MAQRKQTAEKTADHRTTTARKKNASSGRDGPAAPRGRRQSAATIPEVERLRREAEDRSQEVTQLVAGLRHEADEARQQIEDARQETEGIHVEVQQFRTRAGEVARELYQAEELARQQAGRCDALQNAIGHAEGQLSEASEHLTSTASEQIEWIRASLQAARTEAEQTRQDFATLREATRQQREREEETRKELDQLRQQLEQRERELAELKKRSAATRQQADFLDEEMRVTHRMLRQTRDHLRNEGPGVLSVPAEPSEAAPAEPATDEGGALVTATVAAGSAEERLVRYLNDAWSVETTLLDTLNRMAQEVIDPRVKEVFVAHRETTARQRDDLAARLRELGREPSGGKGFFNRLVGSIWEALHRPGDDLDRTTQDLMKGYATEHFEAAMYEALEACARAADDAVTAALARRHQQEEREAADKVWTFLAPTAALVAQGAG